MARPVPILLLAAGASRRMRGADKLMQAVDGEPLIRRQARAAAATGEPVIVALPRPGGPRAAALAGAGVLAVEVAGADEGMAASIRRGVAALPASADGVVVLPADMPDIGMAELAAVIAAFRAAGHSVPVRATAADGTAGHPVAFPASLFGSLAELRGDAGARALLEGHPPVPVALPGRAALTDLDTPEDWAAWRKSRGEN